MCEFEACCILIGMPKMRAATDRHESEKKTEVTRVQQMLEILNLHKYDLYKTIVNIYHSYCYKSVLLQSPSFSALLLSSFMYLQ